MVVGFLALAAGCAWLSVILLLRSSILWQII
jgi:hypothetical protein